MSPDFENVIDDKEVGKELGIYLSSDVSFATQVVCKVKKRCGWIYRVFNMRDINFRRFMWRTYVLGILDYGSQLWCPIDASQLAEIEGL